MKALGIALSAILLPLAALPAQAMRIDVPADSARTCLDSRSPVILLRDVPKGTATLRIRIGSPGNWTDVPTSKVILYTGNRIDKGAVRHFLSCHGGLRGNWSGRSVEIRVDARDASGRRLASARDRVFYRGF